MIDEDLANLLIFLSRMEDKSHVQIGDFRCHATELKVVVIDAMRYRAIKAESP